MVTSIQTVSSSRAEFIELIKKDHPELASGGGCGQPIKEVGKYMLIKVNDKYFVKNNSKSFNPHDLSLYNYEEF